MTLESIEGALKELGGYRSRTNIGVIHLLSLWAPEIESRIVPIMLSSISVANRSRRCISESPSSTRYFLSLTSVVFELSSNVWRQLRLFTIGALGMVQDSQGSQIKGQIYCSLYISRLFSNVSKSFSFIICQICLPTFAIWLPLLFRSLFIPCSATFNSSTKHIGTAVNIFEVSCRNWRRVCDRH